MIYLDNSATTRFKPECVINAMVTQLKNSCNPGRSGHKDCNELGFKIYTARETVKSFLGADDDYQTIFTSGCTEALNLAIFGSQNTFGTNYQIITTLNEHNSVLRPITKLAKDYNIDIIYLTPNDKGVVTADMLENSITDKTKLVIINHTSNVTGANCDIGEIGKITHKHGIKLLVDSAQSLGHCSIDVTESHIDMLAIAGHKGIYGPQGIGALILHNDVQLTPVKYGGTGTDSNDLNQPLVLPEAFEAGTCNSIGILGMEQAFLWSKTNKKNIHQLHRYLSSELIYGLKQIKGIKLYSQFPSSVISFSVDKYTSSDVADYLSEHNIAVRSGLHCAPLIHKHLGTIENGLVRASIGYNNTIIDIRTLLIQLEKLIKIQ